MKGQILDYSVQTNTGTITGEDGARYLFSGTDWLGHNPPTRGMMVDFEVKGAEAKAIYIAVAGRGSGGKDKMVAGLLAIFLGSLGIHKFYLGFTGPGLVYLLVNTVGWAVTWIMLGIPNMVLGVMALIEGIIYLTQSDEEFEQKYVIEQKQWF
jgi:TM2 domain-containing membrane protein YozV